MKNFLHKIGALFAVALAAVGERVNASLVTYLHSSGLARSMADVTAADFMSNRVTNPNQSEIYRQRLYDFQLYPAAGITTLTFFQAAVGQGITSAQGATVGTSKTTADTNMELSGTLPSGKAFLIDSIEVLFTPGSVPTANTYTPANVSVFAAVAAAAVVGAANDVNTFYQSGTLELNVLSKNYLRETPLLTFPPKCHFDVSGAVASNSATTSEIAISVTKAVGRPYFIDPRVALQPAVNFEVRLLWPGVVAAPSGFNGRVGVILDGYFMRASQ